MHEFSLAQGLMSQLLQLAEQNNATRIIKVKVTVGRLSGIVVDSFSFGFETLSRETSLTNRAVLEITESEPVLRCLECDFINDPPSSACKECNSTRLMTEGGDDLILTQVEME